MRGGERISSPQLSRPARFVLSVEDDEAVYQLIRSAIQDLDTPLELQLVVNGEDALKFLKRLGRFNNAPRPSLILLNINLPKVNGPEVLAEVQADE